VWAVGETDPAGRAVSRPFGAMDDRSLYIASPSRPSSERVEKECVHTSLQRLYIVDSVNITLHKK
jgi:hypothetical protein